MLSLGEASGVNAITKRSLVPTYNFWKSFEVFFQRRAQKQADSGSAVRANEKKNHSTKETEVTNRKLFKATQVRI